jgi:hypothetical protein
MTKDEAIAAILADEIAELEAMKAAGQIESYELTPHLTDYRKMHYRLGVKVGGEWEVPPAVIPSYFATLDEAMAAAREFVAGFNRPPLSDELEDVLTCRDSEGH